VQQHADQLECVYYGARGHADQYEKRHLSHSHAVKVAQRVSAGSERRAFCTLLSAL